MDTEVVAFDKEGLVMADLRKQHKNFLRRGIYNGTLGLSLQSTAAKEGVGSPELVTKSLLDSVWFGESEDLQQHRETYSGTTCKKAFS